MNRRNLSVVLFALLSIGLVALGWVAGQSLWPSARTDAELPRIPISSLTTNSYRFAPDPLSIKEQESQIFFVRTSSEKLYAWYVPQRDGIKRLPDGHWWKHGYACNDLRPDFKQGIIHCGDDGLPQWAALRYRWSLDGKSLSDQVPDMEPVPGTEESGYFVLLKRTASWAL